MARIQKPVEGQVKARVLVSCALGEPDDVVEVPAEQLEQLAGQIDADPAAVEYAESLKQQ